MMTNEITQIELSKSDRARCKGCGRNIGLKTPRGVSDCFTGGHIRRGYSCFKCSERNLDETLIFFKKLKRELKKMIKKNQPAIILQELDDNKNGGED